VSLQDWSWHETCSCQSTGVTTKAPTADALTADRLATHLPASHAAHIHDQDSFAPAMALYMDCLVHLTSTRISTSLAEHQSTKSTEHTCPPTLTAQSALLLCKPCLAKSTHNRSTLFFMNCLISEASVLETHTHRSPVVFILMHFPPCRAKACSNARPSSLALEKSMKAEEQV